MGRRAFRQSEITRACKGLSRAGLPIARVRIDQDGVIELATGTPEGSTTEDIDLDRELAAFEAKNARKS